MEAFRMIGGGGKRKESDFYSTPRDVTLALLRVESGPIRVQGAVWDPACGSGAICKVFEKFDIPTLGSDLFDRGYGKTGLDFLKYDSGIKCVITNPPFSLAEQFIKRGHELKLTYMALLLKATYWHAKKRQKLWNMWQPLMIYPLLWRPDFEYKGAPTMDFIWCVWTKHPTMTGTHYMPVDKNA